MSSSGGTHRDNDRQKIWPCGTNRREEVFNLVLERLRRMARSCFAKQGGKTPTFQTDDLVDEAALALLGARTPEFESFEHFENWSWEVIGNLHADHWRRKLRKKRGGGAPHVQLDSVDLAKSHELVDLDLLALRRGLEELRVHDSQLSRIVTQRFILGRSVEETSQVLEVSRSTVKRRAAAAKLWLEKHLRRL